LEMLRLPMKLEQQRTSGEDEFKNKTISMMLRLVISKKS